LVVEGNVVDPGQDPVEGLGAEEDQHVGGEQRRRDGRPYSSATCRPSRGIIPFVGSKTKPRGRRKLLMPDPIPETAGRHQNQKPRPPSRKTLLLENPPGF